MESMIDIQVEEISPSRQKFIITIPADDIEARMLKALQGIEKRAATKGFRPGKTPQEVLARRFGDKLRNEALGEAMRDNLSKALDDRKRDWVGEPEINVEESQPKQQFKFSALVWCLPELEVAGYDSFEVKVPKFEVTEERIDDALKSELDPLAVLVPVENRTVVVKDDVVSGTITVRVNGRVRAGPEPLQIRVGAGEFNNDVENELLGKTLREVVEVNTSITIREKGKEKRFTNALVAFVPEAIFIRQLPEINDEFVTQTFSTTLQVNTVAELREYVRNRLTEALQKRSKELIRNETLKQLISRNTVEPPLPLVMQKAQRLAKEGGFLDRFGGRLGLYKDQAAMAFLGGHARDSVLGAILLDRVAQQENISVDKDDFYNFFEGMDSDPEAVKKEVDKYLADQRWRESVEPEVRRFKTIALLAERATVEYVDAPSETKAAGAEEDVAAAELLDQSLVEGAIEAQITGEQDSDE